MGVEDCARSTGPLILLGFGRLISTVSVDYQVHVGEYGVHWNFFFTLAAVSILTSLISISPKCCGVLGLLVLIGIELMKISIVCFSLSYHLHVVESQFQIYYCSGYQTCLLCGLNDYLLSNKRTANIISQNKEGIFSIFGEDFKRSVSKVKQFHGSGYWGLYLVGVFLGKTLFFGDNYATSRIRSDQRTRTRIWILAIMFWVLTVILDKHVERVSRRMCNLAYVTLVLAQNFQVLAILMLSEFNGEHKMLVLEEAFCRNLLGIFLLANVFTGLINMYVDTIYASSVTALAILSGYAFVLCVFAGFAECIGIKFKFW
ncbi:hypothetical protein IFM89_022842 [Coptis chinensis]|uniref:GPI-anchored wall transfer protein n=1 Tax=Coptis chinensis TaxID=261450 RepID=A0A835IUN2_9MAGN|nr:hypothetical protein IFM89_022842 [Coptis chinensis]